jgi:hypothetical protein
MYFQNTNAQKNRQDTILKKIKAAHIEALKTAIHSTLTDAEKQNLFILYEKLSKSIQPSTKNNKVTKKTDIIQQLFDKISTNLKIYSDNPTLDTQSFSFDFNSLSQTDFSEFNNVTSFVSQLNMVISTSNKQLLLLKSAIGFAYKKFKLSIPKGQFINTCEQNGLCSKSVNQFIHFYDIYSTYPRIIICNISFGEIITNWKSLIKKIEADTQILSLLKMELKTQHSIIELKGCLPRMQDQESDTDENDNDENDSMDTECPDLIML